MQVRRCDLVTVIPDKKKSRDVFGPEGRLIEITSSEVQELAVTVIRAAEETFTIGDPELSYWWTGLGDEDDDKQWVWETSE